MGTLVKARLRRAGLMAALLAAAACENVANPVAVPQPPAPGAPGEPAAPITIQTVQCRANREQLNVTCGAPVMPEGLAGDIIVGGQNVYVRLTSSNVAYNAGTGRFTFDVTLTNLIEQPMGTADGTTLDPNGVRIFFHTGPTVTSGSGTASVVPDGFATFTQASQPFYQYNQVVPRSATTAAHGWTLIMPPSVGTFEFTLLVSAPVPFPNGYITLNGQLPGSSGGVIHPSTPRSLAAVVKTALGTPISGAPVTFGTTDPACATVDPAGTVTGVRAATCTITATSGSLAGSQIFNISGAQRSWTGALSADWSTGGNWGGGVVPAPVDTAVVPTGVPNFPALSAATSIGGVSVADGATVSLGVFNLTAIADVTTGATAGSGILGTTGELVLAGTGGVRGRAPSVRVLGTYALTGNLVLVAPQTVDAGMLDNTNFELRVDSQ